LAEFFRRAIAREPTARFQSAEEMCAGALGGSRTTSMPHSQLVAIPMIDSARAHGAARPARWSSKPQCAKCLPLLTRRRSLRQRQHGHFGRAVGAPVDPRPVEPAVSVITQAPARGIPAWVLAVACCCAAVRLRLRIFVARL
jgi:hypothetical protein